MSYQKYSYQQDTTYHTEDALDIRQALADFILNVQFPRDFYSILVTFLVIYITWRLVRFTIRLMLNIFWPFIVFFMIAASIPFLYQFLQCMNWNQLAKCTTNGFKGSVANFESSMSSILRSISLSLKNVYSR